VCLGIFLWGVCLLFYLKPDKIIGFNFLECLFSTWIPDFHFRKKYMAGIIPSKRVIPAMGNWKVIK